MKKKFKLNELNVQSFVTAGADVNAETLKGGLAQLQVDRNLGTKACNTVYDCDFPTLPVGHCTLVTDHSFRQCDTLECTIPVETCLNFAVVG
jgi:hypothetical protein